MRAQNRTTSTAGFAMVYCLIAVTALTAIISLSVDLGRVQLVKTQLQSTATAAARAGAAALVVSDSQVRANAIAFAAQNDADGTSVIVDSSDIEIGNWDEMASPQFSTERWPTNAVRVRAERTAARGNAVPLLFAFLIGFHTCDVRATAVATSEPLGDGFIGLSGIDVKNNLISASYNSAAFTNPGSINFYKHGMLGSNGAIMAKHNEVVGQVVLGPAGSSNLSGVSGPLVLPDPIPAPVIDFSAAPASNPGGTPTNLNVVGSMILGSGNYYFTSITIANGAKLSFLGPATLYVDGNVVFAQNGEIEAAGRIPGNLTILQRGAGSEFGTDTANDVTVTGIIRAPQSSFAAKNSAKLMGSGFFGSITSKNNAEFYYDQSLHASLGGVTQRWPLVTVQ